MARSTAGEVKFSEAMSWIVVFWRRSSSSRRANSWRSGSTSDGQGMAVSLRRRRLAGAAPAAGNVRRARRTTPSLAPWPSTPDSRSSSAWARRCSVPPASTMPSSPSISWPRRSARRPPTPAWPACPPSTRSAWCSSCRGATATRPGSWPTPSGVSPKETAYTTAGGNTPQMLVNTTAEEIQRGELDIAVLSGCGVLAHPHEGPQGQTSRCRGAPSRRTRRRRGSSATSSS